MKALFADLSEQTRRWHDHSRACRANERRQVLALCDAIQVASPKGSTTASACSSEKCTPSWNPRPPGATECGCGSVHEKISYKRLTALPFALRCRECEEIKEIGERRSRRFSSERNDSLLRYNVDPQYVGAGERE